MPNSSPYPAPSALTPAMRGVLERMQRAGYPPLHTLSPPEARAAYAKGCDVLEVPRASLARVQDFTVPARDGAALPARLYAASHAVLPVLLYLHGGGFTIGSVQTHDILCRELARLSGAAVLSLDYRLAPEYAFPTAVHDAWDTLQWLAGQGAALGLDTTRLAVGGDSAGGTLAAVCALMARDAGLPLALQLLIYPGCVAYADTPSHHRYAQGYVLDAASVAYFFAQYMPDPAKREDWRFAPCNAADHSGLAPAWIGLAECDPLVDEGMGYGDALRAAGGAVELEIYRGVTHEFIKMGRAIPEALQAHQHASAAIRRAFHLPH
ncbi:MAG: alpha/beta hydrolase [Burkholderiaceae bacterium]